MGSLGEAAPASAVAQSSGDLDTAILSSERDRRKRRQKFGTACYPCRQRKVKCTYEVPCAKCVERDHPELCVYDHQPKRVNIEKPPVEANGASTSPSMSGFVPKSDWDRLCRKVDGLEQVITDLRDVLRDNLPSVKRDLQARPSKRAGSDDTETGMDGINASGILTGDDSTGETMHIGASSVPAMVMAMTKGGDDSIKDLADKAMLPLFALDNESATYPFVDLWGIPHGSTTRLSELSKLMPSDAECLELFRNFRDNVNVIFPVMPEVAQFEVELMDFLIARGQPGQDHQQQVGPGLYGKSMHWIGLFFATLACGCQCTSHDRRTRQLTSQVYVCCAYESLRMVNYLARASLTDIQTLLIIGNVLSNSMNAGVAWSLLGLTTRLAQALGLNHDPPANVSKETRNLREQIWERIIWQDSLLSVSFDRPSMILTISRHSSDDYSLQIPGCYRNCMQRMSSICLEMVSRRTPRLTATAIASITDTYEKIQTVLSSATGHLADVSKSKSSREQLEHWNLQMHCSYVTSELCRPLLGHNNKDDKAIAYLLAACLNSLRQTVRAYSHLQRITAYAKYSWAAVHRALSSALLLCIIPETRHTSQTHETVRELIKTLSDIYSDFDISEVPTPISRALSILGKLLFPSGNSMPRDTSYDSEAHLDSQLYGMTAEWINGFSDLPDNMLSLSDYERSPYTAMNLIMFGKDREPSM